MGLWERVSEKRAQHKQKKVDSEQDAEIKKLRDEMQEFKNGNGNNGNNDRGDRGGRGDWDDRGDRRGSRGRDDVGYALERDGRTIQRTYDDMYGRLGDRFARGDCKQSSTMLHTTVF